MPNPPNGYQIVGYYVHFVFAFAISRWVFFFNTRKNE